MRRAFGETKQREVHGLSRIVLNPKAVASHMQMLVVRGAA